MAAHMEHQAGCPRLLFWDAGEWEAACTCDIEEPGESCILCDAPWTEDHPAHCPEWPKEDHHE